MIFYAIVVPIWPHFGVILAVLGGSGGILGRLGRVLAPLGAILGRLGAILDRLGPSWELLELEFNIDLEKRQKPYKTDGFSLFLVRLGSQNHPQHKPDLTWSGKRRSF